MKESWVDVIWLVLKSGTTPGGGGIKPMTDAVAMVCLVSLVSWSCPGRVKTNRGEIRRVGVLSFDLNKSFSFYFADLTVDINKCSLASTWHQQAPGTQDQQIYLAPLQTKVQHKRKNRRNVEEQKQIMTVWMKILKCRPIESTKQKV